MSGKRSDLSAVEIDVLYETLDRRLDRVGIATQPEVATSILELTSDLNAGPADFAAVLKSDGAMTGRLLKMANSAYFAQRDGVTSVERACVVLGMGRLKAVSLGFYLGREASGNATSELSRRVWGQSLFRACMGAELAKKSMPTRTSEAFVIGLMLDCGVALMPNLIGDEYLDLEAESPSPTMLFRTEFDYLPFTHADVATVLCRRWGLPSLLTKPIEWRYVPPVDEPSENDTQNLQRLAHYIGAIAMNPNGIAPKNEKPNEALADRLFRLRGAKLQDITKAACNEYKLTSGLFSEVADMVEYPEEIAAMAHNQLVNLIEASLTSGDGYNDEGLLTFTFGGMRMDLCKDVTGHELAVVYSASGEPLVTYRFIAGVETPEELLRQLGIDHENGPEFDRLDMTLSALAA